MTKSKPTPRYLKGRKFGYQKIGGKLIYTHDGPHRYIDRSETKGKTVFMCPCGQKLNT